MSRLTRDGTAEPVSRDQILRRERGQGNDMFPIQLTTSRIGNLTRLIYTPAMCVTIHTYVHTSLANISTSSTVRVGSLPTRVAAQSYSSTNYTREATSAVDCAFISSATRR